MAVGKDVVGQGMAMPYKGLEAYTDLWRNVIRSPSRRTKGHKMGAGSERANELKRDGVLRHEEVLGDGGNGSRGRRVEEFSRRKEGVVEGVLEDKSFSSENQNSYASSAGDDRGSREVLRDRCQVTEKMDRKAREQAFDAGLIGRGGVVDPGVENVILVDFHEPMGCTGGESVGVQREVNFDLNVPLVLEDGGSPGVVQQVCDMNGRQ